ADAALAGVLLAAVAVNVPAALRSAYAWLGLGILTRAVEAWGGGHALTASLAIEAAGLFYAGVRGGRDWMRTSGLALLVVAVAGAVLHLIGDTERVALFNLRTFAVGAVVLSLFAVLRDLRSYGPALEAAERGFEPFILVVATGLALAAATLDTIAATQVHGFWTPATQTGISVLWSFAATALIALGFRFRSALARWIGIALFALTVAKVFAVDLTGFDVLERVISALVLGAVLVVAAGIYQLAMVRERRAPE
ncbi:MAG TPA: DUF2339 domain-containing protein, partial [Candidatus Elarobacter sp.]